MKQSYLIFLFYFATTSCAQSNIKKDEIQNVHTSGHVEIAGTGVSLIPPPNYHLSLNFPGFMKNQNSAIFVSHYTNQNFEISLEQFGKEYYSKKGATKIIERKLTINGYNASLLEMTASSMSKGFGLVIGDSLSSVMIMALCPFSDSTETNELRKSLLTIYYDKKSILSPLESANFSIDITSSNFKFVDYAGGSYIYTVNGKPVDYSSLESRISISPLMAASFQDAKIISETMVQSMINNGFILSKEVFKSNENINGFIASERIFDGTVNGQKCKMYLLVIIDSENALVIQGVIKSDFDKSLDKIKTIAHTAKFKSIDAKN